MIPKINKTYQKETWSQILTYWPCDLGCVTKFSSSSFLHFSKLLFFLLLFLLFLKFCFCSCPFTVFFFFFFFFAASTAYGGSQARGLIGAITTSLYQHRIWATSATYSTGHGNAGSLTHWARPGMEPACLWMQVSFVSAEPWWELPFTDS